MRRLQFTQVPEPHPDVGQVLPAQSPCAKGRKNLSRAREKGTRQIKQVTYAKCEVKYYLVVVKVIVVVAKIRAHGEIGGRDTPTRVRVERSSSLAYLRWYVGAVPRPEVDLNAERSRSHHDEVSTTVHIEFRAVGRTTIGEGDTTSCIVVDGSIAVGASGSSVWELKIRVCTRKKDLPRL